jgi:nucleoside-diphosphate-sugar epimerase
MDSRLQSLAEAFARKHVLITGGLGFIGSNLARALAASGAHVTVVDSLVPEYGGNLYNLEGAPAGITVNISDIRDRFSMRHLLQNQDVLFNLAGQTSHLDSMQDPHTDFDINARAQLTLLESCRHVNPDLDIVFASTRQVYGRPEYLPVDEQHPIRPVDVNGVSKVAGEQFHLLYHQVYDLRTRVIRMTNTYGPRMRIKDARQTFLGVWIKLCLINEPIQVWGGTQLRDFNYVDDVLSALLRVAADPNTIGEVYNLGSSEPFALCDVAKLLVDIAGQGRFEICEFPAERKNIEIGDYYSDSKKIHTALGWEPSVKLDEGLARTVLFFRERLKHFV